MNAIVMSPEGKTIAVFQLGLDRPAYIADSDDGRAVQSCIDDASTASDVFSLIDANGWTVKEDVPIPRYLSTDWARMSSDDRRRAKVDGETSEVNGQFYEGGQWMPIHGESEKQDRKKSSGRARKARVPLKGHEWKTWQLVEVPEGQQAIDHIVSHDPVRAYHMVKNGKWDIRQAGEITLDQLEDLAKRWQSGEGLVPDDYLENWEQYKSDAVLEPTGADVLDSLGTVDYVEPGKKKTTQKFHRGVGWAEEAIRESVDSVGDESSRLYKTAIKKLANEVWHKDYSREEAVREMMWHAWDVAEERGLDKEKVGTELTEAFKGWEESRLGVHEQFNELQKMADYRVEDMTVIDGLLAKYDAAPKPKPDSFWMGVKAVAGRVRDKVTPKPPPSKDFDYTDEQALDTLPSPIVKKYNAHKQGELPKPGAVRLNLNGRVKTDDGQFFCQTMHPIQKNGKPSYGKAESYARSFTIRNASFTVNPLARFLIGAKIKNKYPMASVDGDILDDEGSLEGEIISFNPTRESHFVDKDGRAVASAEEVTVYGTKVYARGKLTYVDEPNEIVTAEQIRELVESGKKYKDKRKYFHPGGVMLAANAKQKKEILDALDAMKPLPDGAKFGGKPKEMSADAWIEYVGPKDGEGWINTATGDIRYVDDKPGDGGVAVDDGIDLKQQIDATVSSRSKFADLAEYMTFKGLDVGSPEQILFAADYFLRDPDHNRPFDQVEKWYEARKFARLNRLMVPESEDDNIRESVEAIEKAEEEWKSKGVRSKSFKGWFGDWEKDPDNASQAIDPQTGEPEETEGYSTVTNEHGEPVLVNHGTTHAFNEFDINKTNRDNAFGQGHYFTSDIGDADMNYAGEGPDLTMRIESLGEQWEDDDDIELGWWEIEQARDAAWEKGEKLSVSEFKDLIAGMDFPGNGEFNLTDEQYEELYELCVNTDDEPGDELGASYEINENHAFGRALAKAHLLGGEAHTIRAYLNIRNPVKIGTYGNGGTMFSVEMEDDEYHIKEVVDEMVELYREEIGDDEDAIAELEEALKIAVASPVDFHYAMEMVSDAGRDLAFQWEDERYDYASQGGNGPALIEAIQNVIGWRDSAELIQRLEVHYGESTSAEEVVSLLQTFIAEEGITDANGDHAPGQLISDIFQRMGYDGIIDLQPAKRFPGMHMGYNTRHYIVFDSTQIKSEKNRGTFDPRDRHIRMNLNVGDTKVESGKTYTLNDNHRWERADKTSRASGLRKDAMGLFSKAVKEGKASDPEINRQYDEMYEEATKLDAEVAREIVATAKESPWGLTEDEFVKYHKTGHIDEGAYEPKDSEVVEDFEEKYPVLHSTIVDKEGNSVQLRQSGERLQYVATDDDGEIRRGDDGLALYMTDEDMETKGLSKYHSGLYAFREDGKTVGHATDEWGADGVWINKDEQGKGIGTKLLAEFRKQFPLSRKMGQMTPSGEQMARAYYRHLVRQHAEPRSMALQPGITKNENGQEYTLNQNHRWERSDKDVPSASRQSDVKEVLDSHSSSQFVDTDLDIKDSREERRRESMQDDVVYRLAGSLWDADHITEESKDVYMDAIKRATGGANTKALQTIAENIKEVVWYKSVDDITDDHSYLFDDLEPGQRIGGMFDYEKRTMHVDGATGMGKVPNPMRKVKRTPGRPYPARDTMEFDPAHVYAHELGHALDLVVGPDGHHYAWSKTPAWREAWMTEINLSNTPLSKYAKYDQVEGFAEFARLALFNPDIASKEFPKCWEAWKDIGYA